MFKSNYNLDDGTMIRMGLTIQDVPILMNKLRDLIMDEPVTDEMRLKFWNDLMEGCCKYCGRVLVDDRECHCWNDE